MTLNDLYEGLRVAGYFSLADIHYAIVETNGSLSVLPASQNAPPTAKDMSVQTTDSGVNLILINDGKIIKENLSHFNLDESFLLSSIKKHNISDIKKVMIYSINALGQVYLQEKTGEKQIFEEEIGAPK